MVTPYSIAIHGGAGTIDKSKMSQDLLDEVKSALSKAVHSGHQILVNGGDALDAAVAAVKVLEDCPYFNAGKGSVLNHKEIVEMDASVMHGESLQAGAIAGVRHIKNPIVLAQDVMTKSDHVLLIGEGAEEFAFQHGHGYTEQDYFVTERRYEQLQAMREKGACALSESKYPDDKKFGTVGAVALDKCGNLAAATSTGGLTNKRYGRVGDTALIGAGTVAENGNVAVSTTGMGEVFIRKRVASDVAARMQYLNEDVATACESVIQGEVKSMGGEGGLIAIDARGKVHFSMNSSGMYRASIDTLGALTVKVYSDE
ncbi:isoaspartyl peptidase/L-asparaginase [Vibrio profundum]|uniref:isoaspartyl peptidase/L-asparaginase family protein n=1 Tax=Vibrio profundum TaxID=2910247 RepID=UPI003D0E8AEA